MALIRCPDCHRDVSSKATACPNCAYPITRIPLQGRVQVIEKTGRRWKEVRVLGWLLILVALGLIAFGIFSFLEAKWHRTLGGVPV